MITIAFKYKNIRYFLTNILYTYILSILLGGLIYLFNSKVTLNIYLNYLVIIILSIEVMTLYIKENKKIKNTYNNYYKVDIYFKDREKLSCKRTFIHCFPAGFAFESLRLSHGMRRKKVFSAPNEKLIS